MGTIEVSEEQEQMDYEALNAKTALDLNKAQQRIAELEDTPIYKRIAEQDEQIASLQDKVHLCTAYDRILAALEKIYETAPANGEDASYLIAKQALLDLKW